MNKNRPLPLLVAAALCSVVIATDASDATRSIPREAAELYGDLVAMDFDHPARKGEDTEEASRTWASHSTAHFVVLTDAPLSWSVEAGRMLEFTRESFYKSFSSAGLSPSLPSRKLIWVAFRQREEFNRYALGIDRLDMSWSDGYYSTRTNRVALVCSHDRSEEHVHSTAIADSAKVHPTPHTRFGNLAQTTHEAAHQLAFNSGLQKRGVMYPLWASEGLATNFEAESDGEPIGPRHDNGHRNRQLTDAVDRGGLVPLDEFIVLTRVPVADPRATHAVYAQSWAFFRFLFVHRPQQLKRYLDELSELEPGRRDPQTLRREFQRAFGPVQKLERSWQAYVRLLTDQSGKRASASE